MAAYGTAMSINVIMHEIEISGKNSEEVATFNLCNCIYMQIVYF